MPESPRAESPAATLAGWAVMLFAGLGVLFIVARQTRTTWADDADAGAPTRGGVPPIRFTDVTRASGITFTHVNGAAGAKLLPETMGGGVAFLDLDADGDADLLFVNSTHWPGSSAPPATAALYLNDGKGRFTDATAGSGLDVSFYGMGVAAGDFDNDGLPDLFLTGVGGNRLFQNQGRGKFRDITAQAGLAGGGTDWGTSAAWLDYDNDGRLDLFVCHYVRWTPELDAQLDYRLPGLGRAYGPPLNFPGSFPLLYRNEGGGRFADVSRAAGVQVRNAATGQPLAKSLGVAPVDLNGDGWMDLVVANDTVQNFVFSNAHHGVFREIGAVSGLAFDNYGGTRGAMGIDSGRFDDGTALGISIGNFANEMTALYVARRDAPMFADEAMAQGIGAATRTALTFGVLFLDCDLDGWLDLLTANGHIEPDIARADPRQSHRQPAQLFWNARATGRNTFLPAGPRECGPDLFAPVAGRGSAFADMDGDGDLDVVLTQSGGPAVLLRNDLPASARWLRFKLTGTTANRDAIGAWIRVRAGGRTILRQVMPTRGYLSQSELPVTLGLGGAERPDSVEVIWPGGATQRVTDFRLNALTEVLQAK